MYDRDRQYPLAVILPYYNTSFKRLLMQVSQENTEYTHISEFPKSC